MSNSTMMMDFLLMEISGITLAALLSKLVCAALYTINTFRLPFCHSHAVQQLFCDIPSLLKLSCSDTFSNQCMILVSVLVISGSCFLILLCLPETFCNVCWVMDMILSVFYSVIPPLLNPIIYSLRNAQIKCAIRKLMRRMFHLDDVLRN
ncbi:Olfactory receptor 14C36 [Heterocephalus glaber]|uniref:Olfactory receptor 14C36 n=1 Tax=Heterocephalus glaber TaxID=10181 RepID=G5BW73_HETGA|nr:Olfactory receptor 14C36 [Heterocephalus glaber]